MMRKISVFLMVVLFFAFTFVSPTFAHESKETIQKNQEVITYGAGEWDNIYPYPDVKVVTPGYYRTFSRVYSGGGNFKVLLGDNNTGTGHLKITLYDYDGSGSYRKIDSVLLQEGEAHVFDVRGAVDGSDGNAELFVNVETTHDAPSHKDSVYLYYQD